MDNYNGYNYDDGAIDRKSALSAQMEKYLAGCL